MTQYAYKKIIHLAYYPLTYDSNWVDTKIKALFVVQKTVFNIQSLLLLDNKKGKNIAYNIVA